MRGIHMKVRSLERSSHVLLQQGQLKVGAEVRLTSVWLLGKSSWHSSTLGPPVPELTGVGFLGFSNS